MKYWKVIYRKESDFGYWIGQAMDKEHAVRKADIHPDLVYLVDTLDAFLDAAERRMNRFYIKN